MQNKLTDVIALARRLHAEHPDLVDPKGVVRVIPVLHRIAENQAHSVLRDLISAPNGRYPIRVVRVNKATDNHLYSAVYARRNEAIIELAPALNQCWTRFCVAKELLHLYTGTINGTPNVGAHLTLARNSRFVPVESLPRATMDDETFCLYLAIEVMLPWDKRLELSDMHDRSATNLQMAKRFMVPSAIIEHYFDSGYGQISFTFNRSM